MRDRIPTYPGRIVLTPVDRERNIFDMSRADEPIQEGTPLNRKTLFSDEAVLEFGMESDATPSDAMIYLNRRRASFESEMNQKQDLFENEIRGIVGNLGNAATIVSGSYAGIGGSIASFTLPIKPIALFIHREASRGIYYYNIGYGFGFSLFSNGATRWVEHISASTYSSVDRVYSLSGNTVSIETNSSDPSFTLNSQYEVYNYVAIGAKE